MVKSNIMLKSQIGLQLWETIIENNKISVKESLGYLDLYKHKPWLDEERSKL
jgi:hypothetical protein